MLYLALNRKQNASEWPETFPDWLGDKQTLLERNGRHAVHLITRWRSPASAKIFAARWQASYQTNRGVRVSVNGSEVTIVMAETQTDVKDLFRELEIRK